jgi:hypothetical protein
MTYEDIHIIQNLDQEDVLVNPSHTSLARLELLDRGIAIMWYSKTPEIYTYVILNDLEYRII